MAIRWFKRRTRVELVKAKWCVAESALDTKFIAVLHALLLSCVVLFSFSLERGPTLRRVGSIVRAKEKLRPRFDRVRGPSTCLDSLRRVRIIHTDPPLDFLIFQWSHSSQEARLAIQAGDSARLPMISGRPHYFYGE